MAHSPATTATAAAPSATATAVGFVEWGPVFAGALVAAAISFVLYSFGSTIGLSFVSPWPNAGLPAKVIAGLAAFWVVASQIGSFLVGGYVAGRMRSRWSEVASHEVEFRDGVHGLLVWALGVVIGAGLLLATAVVLVRGTVDVGTRVAAAAAPAATTDPLAYFADVLLRPKTPGAGTASLPAQSGMDSRDEVQRVLQRSLLAGKMPEADRAFLAMLVAQRSGLPPPEAQKRVDDTLAEASRVTREAADRARRGAILTGLVTAVSLLVALASAWWAAQLGGQHRDRSIHPTLLGERRWPKPRPI